MAITGLYPLLVVEASSGFGAIPRLRKQPCASSLRGALQSHVDFEIISSDMLIYISNAEIIHFSFCVGFHLKGLA